MPVGREGEEGWPEPWAFTRAQTCGEEAWPSRDGCASQDGGNTPSRCPAP